MEGLFSSFILTLPRTFGFTLFFPGSFQVFPITARVILASVLAVLLLDNDPNTLELSFFGWPFLLLQEGIFGALMIFPLKLTVDGVAMWGRLLDQGRGQQLGASYGGEDQGSPHAMILQYGVIVSLFSTGIIIESFTTLHKSSLLFPPGDLALNLLEIGALLLELTLQVLRTVFLWFLPVGVLFMISDFGLGIISKLVPGMPIFGEIFVTKTFLLGLMYLFVIIPSFDSIGETFFFIGEQFVVELFTDGIR